MTATTTQTKTIESLLAEGQRVLAAKARQSVEQEESYEAERRTSWMALVQQVKEDLGDWTGEFLHEMPTDFWRDPYSYTIQLRPFGAAYLFAGYYKRSEGWEQRGLGGGRSTFCVQTVFHPAWMGEEWEVKSDSYHSVETNDLAEAIAVCFRATAAYHQCEQECATKASPAPAKPKTPEIHLSPSERDFVLAMRRLISDRIPE